MHKRDTTHRNTIVVGGVEVEIAKGKSGTNEKIHIAHYMVGALRILRGMILDEALASQQTLNHVNYLIQVACLAQSNQWQRVLNYDTIYRRATAHTASLTTCANSVTQEHTIRQVTHYVTAIREKTTRPPTQICPPNNK